MRARQTDAPMVQALPRDREKAWVVAPLPHTEPERLPGTSLSNAASPHRQGRATQAQEGGRGMEVTHGNYVGIDVAKDRLDVVLRPTGEYMGTTNDERGIKAVVRHLRKQEEEEEEEIALVVLEATGGLEQPAAAALAFAGVPVAIVNPRHVRDFAKAVGRLAKTDRIDAAVLAHFAEAIRPEARPLANEQARELAAVLLRRRQLLAMITAEGNRVRTASKTVGKRIEAHLRWLRKELTRANEDPARTVRESPVWREKDDPLHGDALCHPPQPGHPGVLRQAVRQGEAQEGGAHRLHAQAADDPGRGAEKPDSLGCGAPHPGSDVERLPVAVMRFRA